ncbi:transcriptional regulatory protein Pho23p [[Candida] railenensis]|uniref:Chromatin modification-related protein n=1 Tax=[Candida] railenensis TaxID=45579 RepID=A0A9P0VYW9_9ASCO|nr:transcriptional regulatory protein Pho23p [[Candida] railenensis]
MTELQARQKSQRLLNKMKSNNSLAKNGSKNKLEQFNLYKQKAKNISNPNELLPGLNDISDAFEALPLDLIKYFTLLKEIDAKCINTVPQINNSIKTYINNLHDEEQKTTDPNSTRRLSVIRDKILEIIPCLEEKMHVASVATDLLHKHMYRINNDYKLIINNNEIPESIRIGPLNHPAMIMDSQAPSDLHNPNRSAQSQRSESRREALAAKKANKDDTGTEDDLNNSASVSTLATLTAGGKKKGPKGRDAVPAMEKSGSGVAGGSGNATTTKKRSRKELNQDELSRPNTPSNANFSVNSFKGKNGNANNGGNINNNSASSGTNNPNSNSSNSTFNSGANSSVSSNGAVKKRNTKPKKEDIFVNVEITSTNNSGNNNNSTSSGNTEPTYCYCNQVSFGEMVGCDGDDCKREWFHLPCIGFKNPPKGKWYCDDCVVKMKKSKKI